MENEFGLKELYDVVIKATYPIEVGDRIIQPNETIAAFDKIQIANFNEIRESTQASGGYDNRGLVFWDRTQEVQISFAQGIFSKTQYALLTGAKLLSELDNSLLLTQRECLESDEEGIITLKYEYNNSLFVYNQKTGEKIEYEIIDSQHITISTPFLNVIVDYKFEYKNNYKTLIIGQQLTQGFLSLEGKTRIKDDITGQTHTGIILIPKLKLASTLSMRLGKEATPMVGRFNAIALPTGERRHEKVMEIIFLDDDIDSDI